ncbi:MAG: sigma-70 family RNA polymerase sigma factor [Pseudonocardiales bacterium]
MSQAEDLLRELTPQVLATLTRRQGMFDQCEDAVQEALLAAATQWPDAGIPANPRAWLLTVAERKLIDKIRSDAARRRREESADVVTQVPSADDERALDRDDSLTLLFMCCHPALTPPSQIALTLRSVGGLSTTQLAAAFLVPEATMAQRISRAKKVLRDAGAHFTMPSPDETPARLAAVLLVLYLIFNEGYTATSGRDLINIDLTAEATRLTRALHRLLPADGEVSGLLALMLLTDARRSARVSHDGTIVPLAEQDRTRWDHDLLTEGIELISTALTTSALGPYQLQAAIAAVHTEAADTASTDWPQILGLYALLDEIEPNPIVTLNRAIALAMVHGPRAGLRPLESLDTDERIVRHHRLPAVRAHLLEMAGDAAAARDEYLAAARRTTSLPEQRYLHAKALRCQ